MPTKSECLGSALMAATTSPLPASAIALTPCVIWPLPDCAQRRRRVCACAQPRQSGASRGSQSITHLRAERSGGCVRVAPDAQHRLCPAPPLVCPEAISSPPSRRASAVSGASCPRKKLCVWRATSAVCKYIHLHVIYM